MLPSIQSDAAIRPPADLPLTTLREAIQQAANQYFRLVILAGVPGSGKTAALQSIAHQAGRQIVNVNLELSKKMLELTRTQRSRQVERLLKEVIAAAPGDVVHFAEVCRPDGVSDEVFEIRGGSRFRQ